MKNYQAAGLRCAVDLNDFSDFIAKEDAVAVLQNLGFKILKLNILDIASHMIGAARYKVGSRLSKAPGIFDCSSFTKWCYGQLGIWIPRLAVQQKEFAEEISIVHSMPGNLIFTSGNGNGNYYHQNPEFKVGHVGIITGRGTVLHASKRREGVAEDSLPEFLQAGRYRGVGRIVPEASDITTLITPKEYEIYSSDDIRWLLKAGPP